MTKYKLSGLSKAPSWTARDEHSNSHSASESSQSAIDLASTCATERTSKSEMPNMNKNNRTGEKKKQKNRTNLLWRFDSLSLCAILLIKRYYAMPEVGESAINHVAK